VEAFGLERPQMVEVRSRLRARGHRRGRGHREHKNKKPGVFGPGLVDPPCLCTSLTDVRQLNGKTDGAGTLEGPRTCATTRAGPADREHQGPQYLISCPAEVKFGAI